ncbi:protein of unknown function [Caminicella sporogenes DSM 14501]|uniref:DUF1788 domain-containing protein n=1 Tax=Caminicella sporogenes DSM 14501 TaxID=1121266 RepID=A0A1M6MAJ8_9FIRM|nr:DUF1788 domain-containing protein [Caminicella sporogenes]RKD27635.1 hypothetical protein BET04_00775 [Caminicella sporogenes]SHJ80333.1 protein of unknown function [Caminicella sporogenes DSM 14501]
MSTIYERLDQILPKLLEKRFRENKGLGNEIGYYIFDYDPKDEIIVRKHIEFLKQKINNNDSEIQIKEFDLYEIILEILESKGYLDKVFDMEKKKGTEYIINAIKKTLRLTQKNDLVVDYIGKRVGKNDIVFLTGVGKAWPIIRSHTVLNTLHSVIDEVPLILFFPGTYDGLELQLFNEIKDDNYYRAFKLIER